MWDKALDLVNRHPYHARLFGALAQLGERNTGSVEVSGSIPLGSTKNESLARRCEGFFWFCISMGIALIKQRYYLYPSHN